MRSSKLFDGFFRKTKERFSSAWMKIKSRFSSTWIRIKGCFSSTWIRIKVCFSSTWIRIKVCFSLVIKWIKNISLRLFRKVKSASVAAWLRVKPLAFRIFEKFKSVRWRRIGRSIIYPHTALILTLVPLATLFLTYMLINGDGGPFSIASYILAFYTLTVVSFRVPRMVAFFRRVRQENKYLSRYFSDRELRGRISLYLALVINIAYAVFQVGLGLVHSSLFYYTLGGYYIVLSLMRFFVVRHDRRAEEERLLLRGDICRLVGVLLLVMTLVLSGVILHMIRLDVTIVHHEITTIAMAAYTFTALTLAVTGILKDRDKKSLVFMVSKAVSLAAALVSFITLENSMITVFGGEEKGDFLKIMTASTGAVICAAVAGIAVYIIIIANKYLQNTDKIKKNKTSEKPRDLENTKKVGEENGR